MMGILIGAWLDVRSKPLRTFAAIAGMVAAIVAVVLVDAAGVLSRNANSEYIARRYGLPITASVSVENGTATNREEQRMFDALLGSGFVAVSPDISAGVQVRVGSALIAQNVRWVSSQYPSIRVIDMLYGMWPTTTAGSRVAPAVVTEDFARSLGYAGPEAIGRVIWYAPPNFTGESANFQTTLLVPLIINGVATSATNAFDNGSILIVSNRDLPQLLSPGRSMSWLVRTSPVDFVRLQQTAQTIMADNGAALYSVRRVDQSAELAPVLDQQQITSDAVTLVALTVGGLGIFGTGLASVRERGRDFGVRRALGASKVRIFADVIVQTLFEVVLATLIAIPVAAFAVEYFARDLVLASLPLPASTSLPARSAIQGLAGALIVGLIAALIPATNAARLSVVQAIRG